MALQFEWDETKRAQNFAKHDVDLAAGARIFLGHILRRRDGRRDYDEDRYVAVGYADDLCLVVVYTLRNDRIRLISARKGGRRDKQEYQKSIDGRDHGDEGSR